MDEYKSFFLALSQVNAFITFGPRFKGNDDEFQRRVRVRRSGEILLSYLS